MRTGLWMKHAFTLIVAVALVGAVGCGDDDDSGDVIVTQLSGDQEVPPVQTSGSGTAEIVIDELVDEIFVFVAVDGIAPNQITQAHLHAAPAGENGPVVAFIIGTSPSGSTFSATITPNDVIPNEDSGVTTFDELVDAILVGDIYVNVHTIANPAGELRGQT